MSKEAFDLEQKAKEIKAFNIDTLPEWELADVLKSIEQTEIEKKRVNELGKGSKNPSEKTLNINCI